jgi:hypothetical protein
MLDEMLQLFVLMRKSYPTAVFLFITHSNPALIRNKASSPGIPAEALVITEASRMEVPVLVKASDINISFIKPVFSKISSSPTKLGEVLSMGIPVIVNAGVGDVEDIVNSTGSGHVVKDFSPATLMNAVKDIPRLLQLDPGAIRNKAAGIFDLQEGIEKYETVYRQVFGN